MSQHRLSLAGHLAIPHATGPFDDHCGTGTGTGHAIFVEPIVEPADYQEPAIPEPVRAGEKESGDVSIRPPCRTRIGEPVNRRRGARYHEGRVNAAPWINFPDDAIHIWTLPTRAPEGMVRAFERCLAADEVERAARFRTENLRESFVAVHGALRYLLGHYLEVEPASVRFRYGPKGKPALECGGAHFNLSHSGCLAAIAVAGPDCEVGIDVEQARPLTDIEQIARRFFCAEEAAEILSLPEAERAQAFFRCWTRKEAFIKAIGDGLSLPLDSFRVSVHAGAPARFHHIGHDAAAARDWALHDLALAPGYAAALAYRGPPRPLLFSSLSDPGVAAGEIR
jgi:4'-phosphopantetheinyl transferase